MAKKRFFNLVEISIALGVIAVGIVAVVGAFPLAAKKTQNAMTETYAASAADDMMGFIEYAGRQDWAGYFEGGTFLPTSKPAGETARGSRLDNTQGTIYDTATPGVYHIIRFVEKGGADGADGQPVYNPADGDLLDFEAEMLMWRSQVFQGWADLAYSMAVRISVEVSWPAQVPYAQRQKAYYTTELFRY